MRITQTVTINSTPEGVFYWLGNPERAMKWQTSVSKGEILQETPDMIGTTFRETVEEDGRGVEMQGVITDYRENQVLAMHLAGKYNVVDVEWRLHEIGESTRLVCNANMRFRSSVGILSILLRPLFKRKIAGQLKSELAALKKLCEQTTELS